MIKNLLFLSLILVTMNASAQLSISIEPNPAHGTGEVNSSDIEVYATVTNTSGANVSLLWAFNSIDAPDGWLTWICDTRACYDPSIVVAPDNRTNDLAPNESMEFQVHVKPSGVEGFAQINVDIYDASATEMVLGTMETTFETSVTTSTNEATGAQAIRIYPNPTLSYFRIFHDDQVERVEIYNIVGKRVLTYQATYEGQYDVRSLAKGMYVVRLIGRNQDALKTVRLSKT